MTHPSPCVGRAHGGLGASVVFTGRTPTGADWQEGAPRLLSRR